MFPRVPVNRDPVRTERGCGPMLAKPMRLWSIMKRRFFFPFVIKRLGRGSTAISSLKVLIFTLCSEDYPDLLKEN